MAIRRCPYCKAIIDEQDKYCNNCGTQLLFPEDELIEEEIPGDKIIGEEEEKEEETEGKEKGEEPELEAELEEEDEFVEEEDEDEEDEENAGEEDDEDELEESARAKINTAAPATAEDEEGLEEPEEESEAIDKEREEEEIEEEEELGSLEATGAEETAETDSGVLDDTSRGEASRQAEPEVSAADEERGKEPEEDADKKYEVALEEDELVFKTKDITRPAATADEVPARMGRLPDTGSLPPWANRIRETPATLEPEDENRSEPKPVSREWTTDSGIGIPEKITQAALPFTDTVGRSGPTPGQEKDQVEEETHEMAADEESHPASFSMKLRAKLVDLIFVTALWVISLWFTAEVVGVSFFRLLFGSPLPVLAFYAILLILYFFLFLYFLGETLGDHYFSE